LHSVGDIAELEVDDTTVEGGGLHAAVLEKVIGLVSSNSLVYFLATHLRQSRGGLVNCCSAFFFHCGSIGSITAQLYFSAVVPLHVPWVKLF
jgi:hypothetical protein